MYTCQYMPEPSSPDRRPQKLHELPLKGELERAAELIRDLPTMFLVGKTMSGMPDPEQREFRTARNEFGTRFSRAKRADRRNDDSFTNDLYKLYDEVTAQELSLYGLVKYSEGPYTYDKASRYDLQKPLPAEIKAAFKTIEAVLIDRIHLMHSLFGSTKATDRAAGQAMIAELRTVVGGDDDYRNVLGRVHETIEAAARLPTVPRFHGSPERLSERYAVQLETIARVLGFRTEAREALTFIENRLPGDERVIWPQ
jgi:hypothetical protein